MPKRQTMRGKGTQIFTGGNPEDADARKKDAMEEEKNSSRVEKKNGTAEAQQKEKVGFHLPTSLVDDLEDAYLQARRLTRGKVTKSDIARIALEETLTDFEEHGETSRLARSIQDS